MTINWTLPNWAIIRWAIHWLFPSIEEKLVRPGRVDETQSCLGVTTHITADQE